MVMFHSYVCLPEGNPHVFSFLKMARQKEDPYHGAKKVPEKHHIRQGGRPCRTEVG
jgi:hypothetical protein